MKIKILTFIIVLCLITALAAEASTLYILEVHNTYINDIYFDTVVDPIQIFHPDIDNPERVVFMLWVYDYYYEINEEEQTIVLVSTTQTSYWIDNQGGSGSHTTTY